MHFIVEKADGHIEEKNGNEKVLIPQIKSKKYLKKYTEFWDGIKNLIKKIDNKPIEYGKDFTKIKFKFDDNLNKTLKPHNLTVVARSVFEEDGKYYPQFFRWMFVWVIKMLEYEGTDVSVGIDINKSNKSKVWL